ncbi:MAG: hypothetical protein CGW95_07545 [Phenylobacterium zucineum]|nr:MAG: hypothetical protein CGW95_07545 [Phenylobacterium zucineum]
MPTRASPEEIYKVVATAFDVEFYLAIYPDIAETGLDPIQHFLDAGFREVRDPAPWFSTRAYVNEVPDGASENAFYHYLTIGWRQGYVPKAAELAGVYLWTCRDVGWTSVLEVEDDDSPPENTPQDEPSADNPNPWVVDRSVLLQVFDADYYLTLYPDIVEAGIDPLDHFLTDGWREGRNPNRAFSVADYLDFNPDVAALGINPFLHYLIVGRGEGRLAVHDLGFRHHLLTHMPTVAERQDHARELMSEITGEPSSVLDVLQGGAGNLHITFSHDDFSAHIGGVQLCLQREAQGLARRGIDHLHLFPATPWPTLRPDTVAGLIGVLWNGKRLGAFRAKQLVRALKSADRSGGKPQHRTFAIHSLLGHSAGEVLKILQAAQMKKGYLWIHDFTSVCAGFHLMRNDVADCGAPPPDSPACFICVYGDHRRGHLEAHQRLFEALDLTVASPSVSAFDAWRAASTAPLDTPIIIHPHAALTPIGPSPVTRKPGPLKVGFVGITAVHKGWAAFENLVTTFADDRRYSFLHLGSQKSRSLTFPFARFLCPPRCPTPCEPPFWKKP